MLEEYWALMGPYQGVDVDSLEPLRILFGFFPTFRQAKALPVHHLASLRQSWVIRWSVPAWMWRLQALSRPVAL
jgi:hypothetical protein